MHVLAYLSWIGLMESYPKSVARIDRYEAVEESFVEHANSWECSPAQLDLAVWVVMRVAKRESEIWES